MYTINENLANTIIGNFYSNEALRWAMFRVKYQIAISAGKECDFRAETWLPDCLEKFKDNSYGSGAHESFAGNMYGSMMALFDSYENRGEILANLAVIAALYKEATGLPASVREEKCKLSISVKDTLISFKNLHPNKQITREAYNKRVTGMLAGLLLAVCCYTTGVAIPANPDVYDSYIYDIQSFLRFF